MDAPGLKKVLFLFEVSKDGWTGVRVQSDVIGRVRNEYRIRFASSPDVKSEFLSLLLSIEMPDVRIELWIQFALR